MKAIERAGYLAHARSAGFAARLRQSRCLVAEALRRMQYPYIAFSSGKDSTATAALVWEQAPSVLAVYFDADCAFPESAEFLTRTETAGRRLLRWPCTPFLDILARAGGPDGPGVEQATMRETVYAPVQRLIQHMGFDGVFVGLRAEESGDRRALLRARGALFQNGRDRVQECLPVGWWSDRDIWAYIVSARLDYNTIYDRMGDLPPRARRVSYWAGETNRRHGRWAWLRQHYPDLWNCYVARFPEVARFA